MRLFPFSLKGESAQTVLHSARRIPEEDKILSIAMREAVILRHDPSYIHLLSAVIYRIRNLDAQLCRKLNIDIRLVRKWAVNNLECSNPRVGKFSGDLAFDYHVMDEPSAFRFHVASPGHMGDDGQKGTATSQDSKSSNNEYIFEQRVIPEGYWNPLQEFVAGLRSSGDIEDDTRAIHITALRNLLSSTIVQDCLSELGYSSSEIESVLNCFDTAPSNDNLQTGEGSTTN